MAAPYCTIAVLELHAQIQQALDNFHLIQQRHERYRALVYELAAEVRELTILAMQAGQELQTIRHHWAYALIEPDLHPQLYAKNGEPFEPWQRGD